MTLPHHHPISHPHFRERVDRQTGLKTSSYFVNTLPLRPAHSYQIIENYHTNGVLVKLIDHPIFENIVTHVLGLKDSSVTKQLLLTARHMGLAVGWGNFRDLTARTTRLLLDLPIFSTLTNNEPLRRDTIIGDILNNFFTHPLYSGAVVYACFINPTDRDC
jgi:hypothetical protein